MLWVSSTRGSIVGRAQCHAAPASATAVDGRRATVPVTRAERETAASENKLRKADLAEPRAPTPPQLEPATNSGAQVYSARDRSVSRDLRRAFRRAPTARHTPPSRRARAPWPLRPCHPLGAPGVDSVAACPVWRRGRAPRSRLESVRGGHRAAGGRGRPRRLYAVSPQRHARGPARGGSAACTRSRLPSERYRAIRYAPARGGACAVRVQLVRAESGEVRRRTRPVP